MVVRPVPILRRSWCPRPVAITTSLARTWVAIGQCDCLQACRKFNIDNPAFDKLHRLREKLAGPIYKLVIANAVVRGDHATNNSAPPGDYSPFSPDRVVNEKIKHIESLQHLHLSADQLFSSEVCG